MNTLNEIEQAVRQLSPEEFAAFRVWFAEFNTLRDTTSRINAIEQEALRKLLEEQDTDDVDLESQGIVDTPRSKDARILEESRI